MFSTASLAAVDKPFFCHQCDRAVTVIVSPSSDPLCPFCNEGFLEEYENSNSNSNVNLDRGTLLLPDPFRGFNPLVVSSSTVVDLQNPGLFSRTLSLASQSNSSVQPEPYDPFVFLQNHLRGIFDSGADVVFEIPRHASHSGFSMPQNVGDYFIGPGLEQLIQLLADNDPNRYGTPPASKSAIEKLPTVTVTEDLLNSEMNQCAVCIDGFEKDTEMILITRIELVEARCRRMNLPEKNQGQETEEAIVGVLRGGLECRYGGRLGGGTMGVTPAMGMSANERVGCRTNSEYVLEPGIYFEVFSQI
ncbi:E3 ubiquitin-protein ligase RING1-like protein [Cucurbita argyrosperma subsp. argyrosperma]|nr:E3 ubiquitin-protein ligase RING1-like protein [Cucurbita argyrosperma subsp. argyrosperma]